MVMNKMNIKKAGIMLLTILLLMSLVACGGEEVEDAEDLVEVDEEVETEEGKIRVEDDYGSVFESDEPAKTVVSLAPSNTDKFRKNNRIRSRSCTIFRYNR